MRFIPPPLTNNVNLNLEMETVLPQESAFVEDSRKLIFHAVGDTGGVYGDDVEKAIAETMDQQISTETEPPLKPAFLYILGDVIYFNGQSILYDSQFYEPYQYYHAPIFAIPGNHDGDTRVDPGDMPDTEPTLYGFMRNFCASSSEFESPYRATMTQPYVYWSFDTPLARIIGLYSNVDGSLDARGASEQQTWFEDQISSSSEDKALIVTVHHPPYSLDTTHRGYPDIELSIDRAIEATGKIPTIFLSGHIHSYQRYERNLNERKVPYVIAGAGGYANRPQLLHKIEKSPDGKPLQFGFQTKIPGLVLTKYNDSDPGFLRITVDGDKRTITSEYFLVPFSGTPSKLAFDSVTVPWS